MYSGWWMFSVTEDHSIFSGYMMMPSEGVLNNTLAPGSIPRESSPGL